MVVKYTAIGSISPDVQQAIEINQSDIKYVYRKKKKRIKNIKMIKNKIKSHLLSQIQPGNGLNQ